MQQSDIYRQKYNKKSFHTFIFQSQRDEISFANDFLNDEKHSFVLVTWQKIGAMKMQDIWPKHKSQTYSINMKLSTATGIDWHSLGHASINIIYHIVHRLCIYVLQFVDMKCWCILLKNKLTQTHLHGDCAAIEKWTSQNEHLDAV